MVGDLDGNGSQDMVVASRNGLNSVVWYRRAGSTWTQTVVEPEGLQPEAGGTLHDVDGDGLLDIVIGGDFKSNEIWWWKNPGPAGWASPWARYTIKNSGPNRHHDLAFADVDGDGSDEFVFWNQGAPPNINDLYIADVPPNPTAVSSWPATLVVDGADFSEGIGVGDVDGNGTVDLVAGGRIISFNAATMSYDVIDLNLAESGYRWHVADIVAGGRPEILSASGDFYGGLGYYRWVGGDWQYTSLLTGAIAGSFDRGHSLDTGDVNGDGHLDIYAAEMTLSAGASARSIVLLGDGLGGFDVNVVSTGIDNHESRLADMDGDGDLDIASKPYDQATPELRVFLNSNAPATIGPWQRHQIGTNNSRNIWVRHGDLNGDGLIDVVAGQAWFENPGSIGGSWVRRPFPSPLSNVLLVLDLDGDGDLDVFGDGGFPSNQFVWAQNNGSGGFTARTNIPGADPNFIQGITYRTVGGSTEIYAIWNDRQYGIDRIVVPADPVTTNWSNTQTDFPSQGEGARFVDVDGDGDEDFLQGHMWSRRNGDGSYTNFDIHTPTLCCFAGVPAGLLPLPDRISPHDMNGDGRVDVVVSHEYDPNNRLVWYEQPVDPTTEWIEHEIYRGATPVHSLDVADIDGDGDWDVVAGEHGGSGSIGRTIVLQNTSGNGSTWSQIVVHDGEDSHDGAQLVDVDGDGDLDILNIGWHHNNVIVHENLTGTAPPPPPPPSSSTTTSTIAPSSTTTTTSPSTTTTTLPPSASWHDNVRRYRTDFSVPASGVVLQNHPATVGLNLSASLSSVGGSGTVDVSSIRVVEVDAAGDLVDDTVSAQFDESDGFNATTSATGELVLILEGSTTANQTRHYQVYFDTTAANVVPAGVAPIIFTTQGVPDAGASTTRVVTPGGTWFYDMAGGGFTSLVDGGNDWIGYSTAAGGAGEFRGIPNLVAPADGGYFHPGATSASSVVKHAGPIRTTIATTIPGTSWAMVWHIYPDWITGTVVGVDGNYWFQYEGTPGGQLTNADTIYRSSGADVAGFGSFNGDLGGIEWMSAADSGESQQLLIVNHENDTLDDSYRDHQDLMTVAAFGRALRTVSPLMSAPDNSFSVALLDSSIKSDASSAALRVTLDPQGVVSGSQANTGVTGGGGPTTTQPTTTTQATTTSTQPVTSSTLATTTSTTLATTTTQPITTSTQAVTSTSVVGGVVGRWAFGSLPVSGWVLADGDLSSGGSVGWVAADGERRQCGVRNVEADPVLDGFCHATARYERVNGSWRAVDSPAWWRAAVADGTYVVEVTVGEAKSNPSSVAHSVQVEGVVLHDRVSTSSAVPFRVATATVTVTDGVLDVTFEGGSKTKIVSIVLTSTNGGGPTTTQPTTTTQATTTTQPTTTSTTGATPAGVGPWSRSLVDVRSGRAAWIHHADLDGDGFDDLVSGDSWWENPGDISGTWTRHEFGGQLRDASLVIDLDGDGDLDVFGLGAIYSGVMSWAQNDGAGNMTVRSGVLQGPSNFFGGVATKEGPAGLEIWVVWNQRQHGIDRIDVPANPVTGTWTLTDTDLPSQGEGAAWVDVDRDSDLDLLQGHIWSRQEDDGSFTSFELHTPTRCCFEGGWDPNTRLPDRTVPFDVNGDGRIDVVVGHESHNQVSWHEQPPDPTQEWTEHIVFTANAPVHSLDVIDFDGDGDGDIVIGENPVDADSGRVLVLRNLTGDGLSWAATEVYSGESHHDGTKAADLDDDGDLDIYSTGWHHNRVVIYENLS